MDPSDLISEDASGMTPTSNGAAPEFDGPHRRDLEDPSLYINRELSWLEFNERVLQLAEDPTTPLLERVKFCAIWESNMDEFFMVRVATLEEQLEAGRDKTGADGMSPADQLEAIHERVVAQRSRLGRLFADQIRPALAEHGPHIVSVTEATPDQHEELRRVFRRQVFPSLTPLVIGLGRPFPYISNLSLSLAVRLRDPEQDVEALARVKVPKELLGRFVAIGEGGRTLVPLDDLIAANLTQLFPGMEILDHALFRVTRDTDYDVSDETDDLLQAVEEELRRRRFGEVVRLEVARGMDDRLRDQLISAMGLEGHEAYEVDGFLDFTDLWDVYGVKGFSELRDPAHVPVTQPRLMGEDGEDADVFAAMREGDIVVHHPYDSFGTSVERFVRQAVIDPNVLAIKQTVYRTSADSPLVPSLIAAAERGKQAVCMVELKARFDERANIKWAKKLEQAGVHVVYGIPSLKTHCKCVLVARREGDGVRHYVHIGTGNYNPKTARTYTDIGLFTCDPDIGADIGEMFNFLTGYARPTAFRKALVAPLNLAAGILAEIERTIEAHTAEQPSRIRMKMNSLLDPRMIQALYRASQAGVEIELNVRGICALRPGLPGISDKIRVVSIVGSFLEHSRIYSFERSSELEALYIGSADLMPRNLYKRVELVIPVEDERARTDLLDILDRALADQAGSWDLGPDGDYRRNSPDGSGRSSQREMVEKYAARAVEAGA